MGVLRVHLHRFTLTTCNYVKWGTPHQWYSEGASYLQLTID